LDIGVVLQSCFDDTSKLIQGPVTISHSSLALCIIAQHSLRTGAILYYDLEVINVVVRIYSRLFLEKIRMYQEEIKSHNSKLVS
jgi:hypothetical protein